MKKIVCHLLLLFSALLCVSSSAFKRIIVIENNLNISRQFETVELKREALSPISQKEFEALGVKDLETNTILVSQLVDQDQDGKPDMILFQPTLKPNEKKTFELIRVAASKRPKSIDFCYSRFVPERTDDYAWENNKVGFRTFGPVAQQMVENKIKGGTLSSGIDAWLKRVEYPIINKWYKMAETKIGAYHTDHGEGLDNFHVGHSRGVGGIAVKKDSSFYVSKNFVRWKTITTGPIRTSFVLEYADWNAGGNVISETKHISLDYGSNLSRFEIDIKGTDAVYAGLTLHEKEGKTSEDLDLGWISYWEPLDDSELGTGIIVPNQNLLAAELFNTSKKDRSNFFAKIKVADGKAIYYSGFGWKKAGEFTSKELWENYLKNFALKLQSPLKVEVK